MVVMDGKKHFPAEKIPRIKNQKSKKILVRWEKGSPIVVAKDRAQV
jgi:hypothetical protein